MPGLHGDFSSKGIETKLNEQFGAAVLQGMLEGRNHENLGILIPFQAGVIDG